MAAGGAVVARTRETYVCRSMDTECKLVTVAFRPGCIKFSVEEISDISASTVKWNLSYLHILAALSSLMHL